MHDSMKPEAERALVLNCHRIGNVGGGERNSSPFEL
jgi:hypothetical protein